VPGKRVRFFIRKDGGAVKAQVFADGNDCPEWHAERDRLSGAISALCERYGVGLPVPAPRHPGDAQVW